MRQARTGQRFQWKAMNRAPWEPYCLPPVGLLRIDTRAEQLKLC